MPEAAEVTGNVDEIIVIALNRAENVQEVPISIAAFNEETLE